MLSNVVVQNGLKAAAAAWAASFFVMDCSPSLYWKEKYMSLYGKDSSKLLKNKRIWIVGASSGIGEELAYQLSSLSAVTAIISSSSSSSSTTIHEDDDGDDDECLHLILSSRSKAKLDKIAQQCRNNNCRVTVLPLDVCNENDLRNAAQAMSQNNNYNDNQETIVIFNAGSGHLSPAIETDSLTAESVWRLNTLWPMVLTPLLFEYNVFGRSSTFSTSTTKPHLVVTSSIAAHMPNPLSSTYCAAKHALHGYFRSFHAENPNTIVHLMCPGPVETSFHANHVNRNKNNKNDDTTTTTTTTLQPTTKPPSKLKMPVQRCARLMICGMLQYRQQSREFWIASQPVLLVLYLEKFLPSHFMDRFVYSKIGPKRVQLWRDGCDLYDPSSWTKKKS